jgi:hypothetical protein
MANCRTVEPGQNMICIKNDAEADTMHGVAAALSMRDN